MTTKAKLLEKRKQREAEAAAQKKKSEREMERRRADYEAEKMEHVKTLMNGALGELVEKMDAEGITDIRLGDRNRVWKPSSRHGFNGWSQAYGHENPLTFDPEPGKKYTKSILRRLRRAGFSARIESEEHQNYDYVGTADGYDIVYKPGTYTVHFLRISW